MRGYFFRRTEKEGCHMAVALWRILKKGIRKMLHPAFGKGKSIGWISSSSWYYSHTGPSCPSSKGLALGPFFPKQSRSNSPMPSGFTKSPVLMLMDLSA